MGTRQCPVFTPTEEEFSNFAEYVTKIQPEAIAYGICKIIPPPSWKARYSGYDNLNISIPHPIRQYVNGKSGVFQVINVMEKGMTIDNFQEAAKEQFEKCFPKSNKREGSDGEKLNYEELERKFWKNLSFHAPMYGADMLGSLFEDEDPNAEKQEEGEKKKRNPWNLSHLDTLLSRKLGFNFSGVTKPYLYFGMWKAMFACHTEDMDLYSINYLHFGKPKMWYGCSYSQKARVEAVAKMNFPHQFKECKEFLRHKSFMFSPTVLKTGNVLVTKGVQEEGQFMITFPGAYHFGFNAGFNCAEAVNFALDYWIEIGKKARPCRCISDSVKIDVDALLEQEDLDLDKEEAEANEEIDGENVDEEEVQEEDEEEQAEEEFEFNEEENDDQEINVEYSKEDDEMEESDKLMQQGLDDDDEFIFENDDDDEDYSIEKERKKKGKQPERRKVSIKILPPKEPDHKNEANFGTGPVTRQSSQKQRLIQQQKKKAQLEREIAQLENAKKKLQQKIQTISSHHNDQLNTLDEGSNGPGTEKKRKAAASTRRMSGSAIPGSFRKKVKPTELQTPQTEKEGHSSAPEPSVKKEEHDGSWKFSCICGEIVTSEEPAHRHPKGLVFQCSQCHTKGHIDCYEDIKGRAIDELPSVVLCHICRVKQHTRSTSGDLNSGFGGMAGRRLATPFNGQPVPHFACPVPLMPSIPISQPFSKKEVLDREAKERSKLEQEKERLKQRVEKERQSLKKEKERVQNEKRRLSHKTEQMDKKRDEVRQNTMNKHRERTLKYEERENNRERGKERKKLEKERQRFRNRQRSEREKEWSRNRDRRDRDADKRDWEREQLEAGPRKTGWDQTPEGWNNEGNISGDQGANHFRHFAETPCGPIFDSQLSVAQSNAHSVPILLSTFAQPLSDFSSPPMSILDQPLPHILQNQQLPPIQHTQEHYQTEKQPMSIQQQSLLNLHEQSFQPHPPYLQPSGQYGEPPFSMPSLPSQYSLPSPSSLEIPYQQQQLLQYQPSPSTPAHLLPQSSQHMQHAQQSPSTSMQMQSCLQPSHVHNTQDYSQSSVVQLHNHHSAQQLSSRSQGDNQFASKQHRFSQLVLQSPVVQTKASEQQPTAATSPPQSSRKRPPEWLFQPDVETKPLSPLSPPQQAQLPLYSKVVTTSLAEYQQKRAQAGMALSVNMKQGSGGSDLTNPSGSPLSTTSHNTPALKAQLQQQQQQKSLPRKKPPDWLIQDTAPSSLINSLQHQQPSHSLQQPLTASPSPLAAAQHHSFLPVAPGSGNIMMAIATAGRDLSVHTSTVAAASLGNAAAAAANGISNRCKVSVPSPSPLGVSTSSSFAPPTQQDRADPQF